MRSNGLGDFSRCLAIAGTVSIAAMLSAAPAAAADKGKLGFVVRDWFTAAYNSKFADECPDGLSMANDEVWWRRMTKEQRAKATDNGLIQNLTRNPGAQRRGPKGEDVCLSPEVVVDEPIQKIIEGKYSYGANLDGNVDGEATAKTCKHQNFIGLDGTPGVDNQLYRLVGCTYGWRNGGLVEANAHEQRLTSGLGMILVEITDVDDPRNDDDVTVSFYRSVDQFYLDGNGDPLPFSSYRAELVDGKPSYGDSVKGAIKDGVLETARADVSLPFYGNYNFMHPVIKDFGLRMEMAADGATMKGMVTGYYNMDEYLYYVGGMVGHASAGDNCPSMYQMAPKLADGYPDPQTGVCTHLSAAFHVTGYAAFVIKPEGQEPRTAQR